VYWGFLWVLIKEGEGRGGKKKRGKEIVKKESKGSQGSSVGRRNYGEGKEKEKLWTILGKKGFTGGDMGNEWDEEKRYEKTGASGGGKKEVCGKNGGAGKFGLIEKDWVGGGVAQILTGDREEAGMGGRAFQHRY